MDNKKRIKRIKNYSAQMGMLFSSAVDDILSMFKQTPKLDKGVMFSFDSLGVNKQKEVSDKLRHLHSVALLAVKNGITAEWEHANDDTDELIESIAGKVENDPNFVGWFARNEVAMDAFISRSEAGLNLSDRIWKPVRQLRDEMEVAMTVSIGDGESASSMSRKVKQYLNDPDLMFRRFRYKIGEDEEGKPVYGKKWKKRIKDEATGTYKWIDYDKDSYKVGAGYYKSASRNAMRVTRTETNMAYRRADNQRWQSLDFVLGQSVHPNNTHDEEDICDQLAGEYPKDFIFDGWHPQCMCIAVPILVPESEMMKILKAKKKGEVYVPNVKPVEDYPEGFKKWVQDNAEKIEEGEKLPYFVRNKMIVDDIIHPKNIEMTAKERAKLRHESRTPEQVDAIQKAWEERKKKRLLIKKTASNIIDTADYYAENIDTSAILEAWKKGDYNAIQEATKNVAKKISEIKKAEKQFFDIIPDVHKWHNKATIKEIENVHSSVKAKLDAWKILPLEQQKKKLEFEVYQYLEANMNGVQDKYPNTWEISKSAYIKRLESVNKTIEISKIKDELSEIAVWLKVHKQSKKVSQLYDDAMSMIDKNESIGIIKMQAEQAKSEYKKRLAENARRVAKKSVAQIESITFEEMTKEEIDRLSDEFLRVKYKDVDSVLRRQTENSWKNLTKEEKEQLTRYTQTYCYLNEPLRGITYSGAKTQNDIDKDLPIMTSALSKCKVDEAMMVRRGTADYNIKELGVSLRKVKEGDVFVDGGFLSTSVHRDGGFGGAINMKILIPKGATGIYAEPFSHYTDSMKYDVENGNKIWNGVKEESTGHEMEWIGQRGSKFKVISNDGYGNIVLQLIGQLF